MERRIKQRLMGAVVLAAISVIVIPLVFDEPDSVLKARVEESTIPSKPKNLETMPVVIFDKAEVITPLINKLPPELLSPITPE